MNKITYSYKAAFTALWRPVGTKTIHCSAECSTESDFHAIERAMRKDPSLPGLVLIALTPLPGEPPIQDVQDIINLGARNTSTTQA